MDKMPKEIKSKLRSLGNTAIKMRMLEEEIESMFNEYEIDTDILRGLGGIKGTEALAYISNGEGDMKENIKEIEVAFLNIINQ